MFEAHPIACQFLETSIYDSPSGTLTSAFHAARREDPTNQYVRMLQRSGLVDVQLLSERTPEDVARFRKFRSNQFHDGGSLNALECLDESMGVKSSWDSFLGI